MIQAITLLVIAALVAIDQVIKIAVVNRFAAGGSMDILFGLIRIRYVENTGAAFSKSRLFGIESDLLDFFLASTDGLIERQLSITNIIIGIDHPVSVTLDGPSQGALSVLDASGGEGASLRVL